MQPQVLMKAGLAQKIGARIVHTSAAIGTNVIDGASTTIDYFVITDDLAHGVEAVQVAVEERPNPHRPTMVTWHAGLADLKALSFSEIPEIPIELPVGPRNPCRGLTWELEKVEAEAAVGFAARGTLLRARASLDQAYQSFACKAEQELARLTGRDLIKPGIRGLQPQLTWRSVLRRDGHRAAEERTEGDQLDWIGGRLRELARAIADADRSTKAPKKIAELRALLLNNWPASIGTTDETARWARIARAHAAADCRGDDFADDMAQLGERTQELLKEEAAANRRGWQEWARNATDAGAAAAHRYLKPCEPWQPSTVLGKHGEITADPLAVLSEQAAKWARAWLAEHEKEP